jgi:putative membrane protein insertion efficiency factor
MSPATRFGIQIVRLYKLVVSPWLPPACRFTPTCSEYAIDALAEYGLLRGTRLAIGRLLRCHPLHAGGFDPLT